MVYIRTILIGCITFPILATIFTLPYIWRQYHKYGSLSKFKTLIVYSFALYMLIAFFMTVLPLPSRESTIGNTWQEHLNLIPFNAITSYWSQQSFNIQNILVYLKSASLWQVLFNILLTVPFGVYLRYYFKQSFKRTILFSFLLSLFYELTQLSALYGIYPGPYRLADVDDLICNTMGGALGYQLAFLFMAFLPSRNTIDEKLKKEGVRVTGRRRFFSVLFDYLFSYVIFLFFYGAIEFTIPQVNEFLNNYGGYSWTFFFVFSLLQVLLFRGTTLGHTICQMGLVCEDRKAATKSQFIKRYILLWLFVQLPQILNAILMRNQILSGKSVTLFFITRGYTIFYFINIVCRRGERKMPHDTLSHTMYVATKIEPKK